MFTDELKTIATALVEANQGPMEDVMALIEKYYSKDIVSVEATSEEGEPGPEFKGMDALMGKYKWWDANFDVHESSAEGPFLHGDNKFAVIFAIDVTHKASGNRSAMKEVGIYTVADGKIVREEFFYGLD